MAITKKSADRKKAEEDFRESVEKYKTIFNESPIGIFYFNSQGVITECNENFISIIGSSRSVLIGFNMLKRLKDNLLVKAIVESLETGQSHYENYYNSVTSGKKTYVKIILKGIRNTNDEIVAGIGLVEDITDRKKTEVKINESEEKYRNLVERANDGICIIQDKVFKFVNFRMAEIWGGDKELMLEKPFVSLLVDSEVAKVTDSYKQRMSGKKAPSIYESRLKRKDGSEIEIEINAGIINYQGRAADLVLVRDISERKKAEKKLAKLSAAVEQSPSIIAITDLNGNMEYVNPKFTELTGYTLNEVMGKNARILKSGRHPLSFYRELWGIIISGNSWHGEFFNRKKNGNLYWESASISPIFDDRGQITNFVKVAEDITDRVKADEVLKESEEKYRELFENSNDCIILHDLEGHIINVNKKTLELFGYSLPELLSMNLSELHVIEKNAVSQEAFKNIAEEGYTDFTNNYKKKNGESFTGQVSSVLIELKGAPVVQDIIRDITQKQKNEKALRESEERFRLAFRTSPDAFSLTRLEDGLVVDMNQGFYEITGYHREEVIGKFPRDLNIWADLTERNRFLYELDQHGEVKNLEFQFRLKNGRIIPALISARPIELNGVPHLLSIAKSVEELKQAQTEIIRSKESTENYLNIAAEIILTLDTRGNITLLNDSGYQLLGYEKGSLLGKNWFDTCMPENFRNKVRRKFEKLMLGKVEITESYENVVVTRDGTEKNIHWHNSLLKDDQERAIGSLSSGEDITKRKLTEKALKESESRYRLLIENSNDAIYLLFNRRFEIVNTKFTQIFGYTLEEVNSPGFDFIHLVAPKSKPLVEGRLKQLSHGKKLTNKYEFTAITKNGKEYEVEVSVSYIDYKDGKATQGIIRDITERKQRNEIIRKAILNVQEKEKMKFGKELHDGLGQILTSASMFLESLYQIKDQLPGKKRFDLERARELNKQAILDARRISHGLMIAGIDDQGIDELIGKMCKNSNTSKTSFSFYPRNITGQKINNETKVHLYRIVQELSTNIIRHSNATRSKIWLSLLNNDKLKLIVTDNGTGFKPEKVNSGTGLQNISQRVTILKGKIDISSGIGIGTRITITVPL